MGKNQEPVKLSAVEQDVLTVLSSGNEQYGYEMLEALNQGRSIPLGFGSLYPVLNRLVKKGLIDSRWGNETEETGGARRKYYRINALGAQTLEEVENYRQQLKSAFAWG